MRKRLSTLWLVLALVCTHVLWADEAHHHFDANERLGTVSFPTSCATAVQSPFERGDNGAQSDRPELAHARSFSH